MERFDPSNLRRTWRKYPRGLVRVAMLCVLLASPVLFVAYCLRECGGEYVSELREGFAGVFLPWKRGEG